MKKFPEKLAYKYLAESLAFLRSKKIISKEQEISVKIASISEKEIKELNKKYRQKNQPTDILSFSYNFDKEKMEGDLVLCWEIIQRNSKEDGVTPEYELAKNLIHGCLHLTDREHSEEMFDLQEEFLKKIFESQKF